MEHTVAKILRVRDKEMYKLVLAQCYCIEVLIRITI